MPYNVIIPYDLKIWDGFLETIKISIRSISGMGFYILAFFIGWVILTIIVNHFAAIEKLNKAVKKRSFTRKVFEADFDRNRDDLIEDGVRHNNLRLLTNQRMRDRHLGDIVTDQAESNRIRLLAKLQSGKKNFGLEVLDKVHSMEVSHQAKIDFDEKHPNASVESKVRALETSHGAKIDFSKENPYAFQESKDFYKSQADHYYSIRKKGSKK